MLTDTSIRAAKVGILWDGSLKGFGIRVGKNRKTFIVLVASGRRKAIGPWPLISLADARKEAKRIIAERTLGRVRPTHTAFADAVSAFLKDCEDRKRKPRTVYDYRRLLKRLSYGRKSIADISPHQIVKDISRVSGQTEKHHVFTAARAFFRYAERQRLVDRSPMAHMLVPAPGRSRERVLTDHEATSALKLALAATTPFHAIVALLLITGQRRGEIAALEWSWIDRGAGTITLPSHITKNGRPHTFPIGRLTLGVIDKLDQIDHSPYLFPAARNRSKSKPATVFNGWGKPKAAFDNVTGITGWTLHDLRRTLRTRWAELGISREVAERYINHISGVHSGIEAVYDRYSYMPGMRAAVVLWEQYLSRLVAS